MLLRLTALAAAALLLSPVRAQSPRSTVQQANNTARTRAAAPPARALAQRPPNPVVPGYRGDILERCINRMRILDLFPPPPAVVPPAAPAVVLPGQLKVGVVTEATLVVTKWTCGRFCEDDQGRCWVLVCGLPLTDKPAQLPGCLLPCDSGPMHFFSKSGRLFRLQASR